MYDFKQPLNIYKSQFVDNLAKDTDTYKIVYGLGKDLAEQLTKYAADKSDTNLQENTSDYKRFVTEGYEKWYSKERFIFGLVDEENSKLAAVLWFGPKEPPFELEVDNSNWLTFAIRSYGEYRGKGITSLFCKKIFSLISDNLNIWLETDKTNVPALRMYEKVGFKYYGENDKRVFMIFNKLNN